eukprot:s1958_g6.t1
MDFVNFTAEYVGYMNTVTPFGEKKIEPLNHSMYLALTPLAAVDTSDAEKLKLWGFWYRKLPDDQKFLGDLTVLSNLQVNRRYVKAKDLFTSAARDNFQIPEPMQNGHPIWSHCGGPELEPMTLYTLANGEESKPAPSECLQKETLKKNFAGLRVCPDKMTRFSCDCKGQC